MIDTEPLRSCRIMAPQSSALLEGKILRVGLHDDMRYFLAHLQSPWKVTGANPYIKNGPGVHIGTSKNIKQIEPLLYIQNTHIPEFKE